MIDFASDWGIASNEFSMNNSSHLDVYIGGLNNFSLILMSDIALLVVAFISDAILVWTINYK